MSSSFKQAIEAFDASEERKQLGAALGALDVQKRALWVRADELECAIAEEMVRVIPEEDPSFVRSENRWYMLRHRQRGAFETAKFAVELFLRELPIPESLVKEYGELMDEMSAKSDLDAVLQPFYALDEAIFKLRRLKEEGLDDDPTKTKIGKVWLSELEESSDTLKCIRNYFSKCDKEESFSLQNEDGAESGKSVTAEEIVKIVDAAITKVKPLELAAQQAMGRQR